MLRTRLWMGAILVALTVAMLFFDERFSPWFPFLFVFFAGIVVLGCVELLNLLTPPNRPSRCICLGGVLAMVVVNWPPHVGAGGNPWHYITTTLAVVVLLAFLVEMATFREPGGAVERIALTVWIVAYLAILPSFLAQVRWFPGVGASALALCIFVPKCCDIGAYFTGRAIGKHKMTPVLSPKKTWEGLVGGLITAALVAWGIHRLFPVLKSDLSAIGFGFVVGGAGVLGDLAESLIKRDFQRKDASTVVPGFGGVLDVIDAVVFAAPVAYWWIRLG